MLTQEDLIAIGNVVDKKLTQRFSEQDEKWNKKLDEKFKKELKPIKSELKKIRKDSNSIIKFFDNEIMGINKRVDRLEDYIQMPSS